MARRHALHGVLAIAALILVTRLIGAVAGLHSRVTVVAEIAALGAMLLAYGPLTRKIDRWRQGAQGEKRVGAILAGLAEQGWLALHDVSSGRGNVDHILVGPAGLFTIETKSHRGRIHASEVDPRMLKQAYAESKWVEQVAEAKAEPLLVFSRAYLTPAVSRHRGVVVLPARMLAGHVARREQKLSPNQVAALHARLAAAFE